MALELLPAMHPTPPNPSHPAPHGARPPPHSPATCTIQLGECPKCLRDLGFDTIAEELEAAAAEEGGQGRGGYA
ncbi:hypothetical protein [Nitrososphaera sp.]|uniref:hypothetical protein n=1 Tax=Nitrososphaera sp. TaxID=1971748 RepID=UPI00307DC005